LPLFQNIEDEVREPLLLVLGNVYEGTGRVMVEARAGLRDRYDAARRPDEQANFANYRLRRFLGYRM
ncbi:hypothetical protein KCU92_g187, partial [Aureobasidium melanogenum]